MSARLAALAPPYAPDLQASLDRIMPPGVPPLVLFTLNTIQEIEFAIRALTPREVEELYGWLEQHCPLPIDTRVQSDVAAGRLDTAIQRALDDEKNGRTQPL